MHKLDPAAEAMRGAQYRSEGYWSDQDLWGSIAEIAALRGQAVAFKQDDRSITFAELADRAERMAVGLQAAGLTTGDMIVIHARNSIESAVTLAACAWLGAVMIPLPPIFTELQVRAVLETSGARAIVCLGRPAEVERAVAAAAECPGVDLIVVPDGQTVKAPARSWSSLFETASPAKARVAVSADALAMLVYSSGTTGTPKGVMHCANTIRYAAVQRAKMHGVGPDDTCALVCQFGFVGGIVFGLMTTLLVGPTSIIVSQWDAGETLRLIERERITYGLFMPTHTHDLLDAPELGSVDLSSFTRAAMGGITAERREEVKQRLCPNPFPGYGMSECLGHATCGLDSPPDKLMKTEGHPYPGTEFRIEDDEGNARPAGEAGNVLVRGPSRCLGYYGSVELNEAAFTSDGFFRTGDICKVDEDGYITFVGREKDIIRRGGVTIVPAEIENVLRRHPRVREAAVVGMPDDRLGERTCACVITHDGAPLELAEITAFVEEQGLARYMWPESAVLCEAFPRTPSLKVMKPALVRQLLADRTS